VNLYADKNAFMNFHENMQNEWSIIIEMQAKGHVMFDEWSIFYASYTFSHQFMDEILRDKDWFKEIKLVYAIQLLIMTRIL
jgi:hypothetical protein